MEEQGWVEGVVGQRGGGDVQNSQGLYEGGIKKKVWWGEG